MSVLLIQPPLCDPSRPHPAIATLAGFLQARGETVALEDASIALLLRVFSADGVRDIAAVAAASSHPLAQAFVARADAYARAIELAVACVQGHDAGARLLATRPQAFPPPLQPSSQWAFGAYYAVQRHTQLLGPLTAEQRARAARDADVTSLAFGQLGDTDRARMAASTVLHDIAAVIRVVIDPAFTLEAYAATLADDPATFAPIAAQLDASSTLLDRYIDDIADRIATSHTPRLIGFSIPFPGNAVGALRMARRMRQHHPRVPIVCGGGWINTQLRELRDPGIFDHVDFLTLDDGEQPLLCLLDHLAGRRPRTALKRTFYREDGVVRYADGAPEPDVRFTDTGTPTYGTLPLTRYLPLRPSLQSFTPIAPARWNALTLAHGCYWKRCAFCDTGLDYIHRYDLASVDVLITRIRALISETGSTAFHFVDEAMPPALLARLADRLLQEDLRIAWWGNARFDAALIPLAPRLAAAGCIGLTGGLEVPVERLLDRIGKGVSLAQAARVCQATSAAGIFTHAYLIYGFPTETAQETIDGLEFVRQMFAAGFLQSAYWHDFGVTAHSPMAAAPERYGITLRPMGDRPFSRYILPFDEPGRIDHEAFHAGLDRAVQHYQLGLALDDTVDRWFDFAVPATTLPRDFVVRLIADA